MIFDGRTLFTAFLLLFLFFLLRGRDAQRKWLFLVFLLGISWVAFHAVSIYDLNNYYAGMGSRAHQSLFDHFNRVDGLSALGVDLWFFLTSKFGYKGFLPFFTVFAFYGVQLYVLFRITREEKTPRKYVVLAAAFLLCATKYYSVLAGIRNHLAFSIFAVSLVAELLWKKNPYLCWLGYGLAILYHNSLLPFVLLRGLLYIYNRYSNWFIMGGLLGVSSFGYPLLDLLSDITDSEFLQNVAIKAEAYFGSEGPDGLSLGNLSTAWVKILCITLLVLYALRLAKALDWDRGWHSYLHLLLLSIFFTVGSAGSQHTLVRFPELLGLLAVPVLLRALPAGEAQSRQMAPQKSCVRRRRPQYPALFLYLFLADSVMLLSFQFLGTLTLIGWQTPAIPIY